VNAITRYFLRNQLYKPSTYWNSMYPKMNRNSSQLLSNARRAILLIIAILISGVGYSQNVVHGTVTDKLTGEVLVAATVFDALSMNGTVSNEYGFYSLKVKSSIIDLTCSYVGYSPAKHHLELENDSAINISLEPSLEIDEVTITGDASGTNIYSSQMSAHNLNRIQLQKMPMLFGETDLVKALQYLPGVSSGMEGMSGIYVRGGGSDQNLILLDGVPVYNVNHLFGFFSVFNGDAVNSATLYKAGFPARYSGRLSSVIDVGLKEGNMKEFHGSASIGLISSKLMLEGPIKKDKTSFMVSGRRTYIDILSYPVQYLINKSQDSQAYLGYYFYDMNAKINHKFSDRSRLYFSSYLGKDEAYINDYYYSEDPRNPGDQMKVKAKTGFNWGNITSALRWNYIWGKQLFSNTTLSYGTYKFRNFESDERIISLERFPEEISNGKDFTMQNRDYVYYSGIKDISAKLDFSYIPSTNQYIRFGMKATRHMFEPGVQIEEYTWDDVSRFRDYGGADTVRASSYTAYLENDFRIGDRFKANVGMSSSTFVVDSKNYYSFEPRVSTRFKITDKLVYKASYAKMSQYVHLLTNAMIGLPTDVWVPTTSTLAPEESWQVATGLKYKLDPTWEFSVELFYKDMKNLVEYAEGADLLIHTENWESKIEVGNGEAYGAEFFVEKSIGRWTGSLAYTWSKNFRTFENISFGEPFPYKYDRRHDISVVGTYEINDRVSMGAVWVYGSGINTTILDQSYLNPLDAIRNGPGNVERYRDNDLIRSFEKRNGYQLPAYHRLDIGFNFEKEMKRFVRTWSFGAYNAYARRNAFYIYTDEGRYDENGKWDQNAEYSKRIIQVTMFPIIPYFRYSIKF
jgi:outer membrane receptor for ferrienterochelin and colicin